MKFMPHNKNYKSQSAQITFKNFILFISEYIFILKK